MNGTNVSVDRDRGTIGSKNRDMQEASDSARNFIFRIQNNCNLLILVIFLILVYFGVHIILFMKRSLLIINKFTIKLEKAKNRDYKYINL